jgi:single-strand DNA-binding protein
MAYDNSLTIIGNATREPELRYTASGAAVCSFSVAWNRKDQEGADVASFFDVTCWRDLAEHVSESVTKGMRVIVYGRIEQESWTTDNDEKRTKVKVIADDVAPSLKWVTVSASKAEKTTEAPPVKRLPPEEPF